MEDNKAGEEACTPVFMGVLKLAAWSDIEKAGLLGMPCFIKLWIFKINANACLSEILFAVHIGDIYSGTSQSSIKLIS